MKRQTAWFITLGTFALMVRLAFFGHNLRQTIAQARQRPGILGRARGGAPASGTEETSAERAGSAINAETREIAGRKVSIWRPVATTASPAPLVIFSHGFHGSSTQSKFLMKALAGAGYLVVAPNHKDAGMGVGINPQVSFSTPAAWSDQTYHDREEDIVAILSAMKKDPAWTGKVDWAKVALAGHSLGGYTALGLAGAWPSWKLPDVKAVLAFSPYCAPYVQKGTLGGLKTPVMYQGGTRDIGVTPVVSRSQGAYDQTPGRVYFVDFEGANHFAWTDLIPQYQSSIVAYSVAFLDKYLRGNAQSDPTARRSDVADLRSK